VLRKNVLVTTTAPSAARVALSLLGASRGRALSAPVLVGAATLLGVTPNAMRVSLSRLVATGEVKPAGRGRYTLAPGRLGAVAHVRTYRTGFAARVAWKGGFLGVLTAALPRRNATQVQRRERALLLAGFRLFRHSLYVRPDNLKGGAVLVGAHLARLGLDRGADLVEVWLDGTQRKVVEAQWQVDADARQASALTARVRACVKAMPTQPWRRAAAASFWLGDEALRFLARDPLLPESLADPEPRQRLAEAMSALDERGYALWKTILDDLEP
jgi:phenylacetic acid degradation operon negative regulatory protein